MQYDLDIADNLVDGLDEFSAAQRIECPSGVWEVIGSNPVRDSDLILCSTLVTTC